MEKLYEIFVSNLLNLKFKFRRYLFDKVDWNNRLTAITGSRGVGKTTMLLQYIKANLLIDESVLFVSLDNLYFTGNTLTELTDEFVKNDGKYLFLDEVHKYPNWAIEIKNIYDIYPNLHVTFTGSSILNIYKGFADLSRRAVKYELQGLSFREYLELEKNLSFPVLTLNDILSNHIQLSTEISTILKPIPEFKNYLRYGYYPYYKESKELYHQKLQNTINVILENDLQSVHNIEFKNIFKLKKLLYLLAESVPFRLNVTKLSERIGVSRNLLHQFLDYLVQAQVVNFLNSSTKGYSYLTKPEKIYMNNTNIMFAISSENINTGNLRETFFQNQLAEIHKVNFSPVSDFLVDGKYTFEIGGKNKTYEQIKSLENAYIAADDIEIGYKNTIPLWLFGFLY